MISYELGKNVNKKVAEIHEEYDEPFVCIAGYASAVLLYGPSREEPPDSEG